MFATTKLRLRQSVGIVTRRNSIEFFKANVRSSLALKMNSDGILEFMQKFNGFNDISTISKIYQGLPTQQISNLAEKLVENYILIEHDQDYPEEIRDENYRIINLLEDYFHKTSEVLASMEKIKKSTVMIIGLGAVGSYVSLYLAKIGIRSFILMDPDKVDISNLHRQAFEEPDIGKHKTSQLNKKINSINSDSVVLEITSPLHELFFNDFNLDKTPDLIINCADEPSVDFTSQIVSKYAMQKYIPHIVGGGYNLHLTLVGQTVIPYKTACFRCFEMALEKINGNEFSGLRRLDRKTRKLGSFSPLSGMAASLAAMDAFKLLAGAEKFLQQSNRRVEFNVRQRKFNIIDIPQNPDCVWCGHQSTLQGLLTQP